MHRSTITPLAGILWAGVAIASGASADATIATSQLGDYASCSADYQVLASQWHGCVPPALGMEFSYKQTIKLVSTVCSSGSCTNVSNTVYSTFVYATGRKVAYSLGPCSAQMYEYDLGSCAC